MDTILKAGTVVGGQFEVMELAGQGGTGDVYLVQHQTSAGQYAMKVLSRERAEQDPALVTHYHLEAAVGTLVTSPNIVKTHGCAEDKNLNIYYLVMDYVQGMNLTRYMESHSEMNFEKMLSIIRECAKGISALSQAGIVHRDIKPDNIIIDSEDKPRLTDFGIALVPNCTDPGQVQNKDGSLVSLVMGTPAYSAPEQCMDSHTATALSDIYSLGICLYQMLTGSLPFPESVDPYETIEHVLKDIPQKPSVLNPAVPSMIDDLVMDMLNRDPEKRPQSADELIRWIDNILWELPKIPVIRKKRPQNLPETEEDLADEDIFAPDMTEAKKKKKLLLLSILVLLGLVLGMALDSQLHFTRHLRLKRKAQKTEQIQHASVPEPAAKPEIKPQTISFAEPVKSVPKQAPVENWSGFNEKDTLQRLEEHRVRDLEFLKQPLSTVLQKLKKTTGLEFVSVYPAMNTPITLQVSEETLHTVIRKILVQCPDSDYRVGCGNILIFSRSAVEAEKKRKIRVEKLAAFRENGKPKIMEAEKILLRSERKIKSLEKKIAASENDLEQLKKTASEAAKLPAALDKAATMIRNGEALTAGLEDEPEVAAAKRKAAELSGQLPGIMLRANNLQTAADTAVNTEKERLARNRQDKALSRERDEEEKKQQQELAEKLRKEELRKSNAEKAMAERLRETREEERRKANALNRDQQINLAKENMEKAKASVQILLQKNGELERQLKEAVRTRKQLEHDNARFPLSTAEQNLAAEQKQFEKWEQKRVDAEKELARLNSKINALTKRGARSAEIRAAEKERNKASNLKRKAAQESSRLRMRVLEAKRIAEVARTVEKARSAEKKIEADLAVNNDTLAKEETVLAQSETTYFGLVYQVKGRDFVKLASAAGPWSGMNDETVQQKMKETMILRLRFNQVSFRKAMELLAEATGLKITVSEEAARLTVKADLSSIPVSDALSQLCTDRNLTTLPYGRTLTYTAAADGVITVGF